MKLKLSKIATLVALITLSLTLYAQQTPPSGPPQGGGEAKNLKVMPKDTPRQRLLGTMNNFTRALGVKCDHCHVQADFSSDEKPEKDVARGMMKMMASIRQGAEEFAPGGRVQKITCWTCHRGSPKIELPAPPQPPAGQGPRPGGEQKPPEKP